MKKYRNLHNTQKFLVLGALCVIMLGGVSVFLLEKFNIINLFATNNPSVSSGAHTTSKAESAQEDFTGGNDRTVNQTNKNEGVVKDTGGEVSNIPPQSQWLVSSDKLITLYTTYKDSILKKGDAISGASSLPKIYFRLIDDVSGVIAQGTLTVIDGKFAGSFDFSTSGTNGRLDVFQASSDGVESSNIMVPVRFR